MKETALNKKVSEWINTLPNSYAYKRLGYIHNKGQPDVTGCVRGIRIEIEGKLGSRKPSDLQSKRLRDWKAAGAITGIYYSFEEAQLIVIQGLKKHGINMDKSVQTNIQNKS